MSRAQWMNAGDDLRDYPFDQYQRYRDVRLVVDARRLNELVSAYASGRFMRFMAALKLLIGLARRK